MRLALGTAQFGLNYGIANASGRPRLAEVRAVIQIAQRAGLDTLDTAISYGKSEGVLGQVGIADWKVVTKLPEASSGCPDLFEWAQGQLHQSLSRLGVPSLYAVLLHRPNQLLGRSGPMLYQALKTLKAEGLVSKVGVSIYNPNELGPILDQYPIDLVQSPLNILDRSLIESGWAKQLQRSGIEIHARSIFLQGLLLMSETQRPTKFSSWQAIWQEWDRWLSETGLTPLQACAQYAVAQDCIHRVVIGVDRAHQLEEVIHACEGRLCSLPDFGRLVDKRLINPATWGQI
jgi:aryl-alcohol dehydrogenase-like predicted oxidoreductase